MRSQASEIGKILVKSAHPVQRVCLGFEFHTRELRQLNDRLTEKGLQTYQYLIKTLDSPVASMQMLRGYEGDIVCDRNPSTAVLLEINQDQYNHQQHSLTCRPSTDEASCAFSRCVI